MQFSSRAVVAGRSIAMAAALASAVGCHKWAPVSPQPRQGAEVRVSYPQPRDVVATTSAGDSVRIAGVSQWTGTLIRAVPETLHVQMISARGSPALVPVGPAVVAVTRASDASVTERVTDRLKTFFAVWVVASIVGLIVFGPGDTTLPGY